jgi:hypothetical protein
MNFIFENKKYLFLKTISNIAALHNIYNFIIVCLNKKVILINKFSKIQPCKYPSCEIKYLDLYIFLIFLLFTIFFVY